MGGGGERVVERTSPSAPMATIPSQFSGYATQVGQKAQQFVDDPRVNLTQFLSPSPYLFSVPPLTPQQQLSIQQAGLRGATSMPGSLGESMAFQTVAGQPFQQFVSGDFGNSPAVRSAIAGIKGSVLPVIQNRRTLQGLGNWEGLGNEEGGAVARELVPLYTGGMQLSAQMTQNMANQFLALEQSAAAARQQAEAFGGIEREAEAKQREQAVREYERVFNLISGYVNPQGNFNILPSPGASQVTRQTTPGGLSMFK